VNRVTLGLKGTPRPGTKLQLAFHNAIEPNPSGDQKEAATQIVQLITGGGTKQILALKAVACTSVTVSFLGKGRVLLWPA